MSLLQIAPAPPAHRRGAPASVHTVALIGQPNCGKSTLFNGVAGYRSETSNFPGTTVQVARGLVRLNGMTVELVDVPGIYSLTTSNPAETAARHFLLAGEVDVIINVLDASLLSRSLELTLELRELGVPTLVCLNMMDDAQRKGTGIALAELEAALAMPVFATIATSGVGVRELFARLKTQVPSPAASPALAWNKDVEQAVRGLESELERGPALFGMPARCHAIKLLEGDTDAAAITPPSLHARAEQLRESLAVTRGRPAETVIMSERHDVAMRLFERVATVTHPRSDLRAGLDRLLTHSLWGYLLLAAIFFGFFWAVFGAGALLEGFLQSRLDGLYAVLAGGLTPGSLLEAAARSLWGGFVGGAAIVLPYLVPFLFGLALLEDSGYLPRVAYLMDGLLHRIGLHGTSMLPLMLGYGCAVPACLATRILPSRRDRFLGSLLATLVPCSARSNIIFALVAFYLGPMWALAMFGFNLVVVIFSGWILTRAWPEVSPGMVLEVPRYQWPRPRVMASKVWLRVREFIVVSWPLLMGGSLVLGLAEFWHWDHYVNLALYPITWTLGLPLVVGTTLVFGLLRRELSLVMLVQALGTSDVGQVLSTTQIVVFTLFVTFYMPCLATLAALLRELGRKLTLAALAYTFLLALAVALLARGVLGLLL